METTLPEVHPSTDSGPDIRGAADYQNLGHNGVVKDKRSLRVPSLV